MGNLVMDDQPPDGATVQYHEDFENFPPGYRFKPTDQELVSYYLNPKLNKQDLPPSIISEVDLYKYSPEQLAEMHKPRARNGEEWYFFTPRERRYRNGERPSRKAGDGYWKATGKDKQIKNGEGTIGFKKSLVFYRGESPKGDKTNWIMHEFRANTSKRVRKTPDDMQLDDWVLCRIYKKHPKVKAKNSDKQDQETKGKEDGDEEDQEGEEEHEEDEDEDEEVETYEETPDNDNEQGPAVKRRRQSMDNLVDGGPSNPSLPSPAIDHSILLEAPEPCSLSPLFTLPGTSQDNDYFEDIEGLAIPVDDDLECTLKP